MGLPYIAFEEPPKVENLHNKTELKNWIICEHIKPNGGKPEFYLKYRTALGWEAYTEKQFLGFDYIVPTFLEKESARSEIDRIIIETKRKLIPEKIHSVD